MFISLKTVWKYYTYGTPMNIKILIWVCLKIKMRRFQFLSKSLFLRITIPLSLKISRFIFSSHYFLSSTFELSKKWRVSSEEKLEKQTIKWMLNSSSSSSWECYDRSETFDFHNKILLFNESLISADLSYFTLGDNLVWFVWYYEQLSQKID